MKFSKKKVIATITLSTMLLTAASLAAYADSTLKQISAYQNAALHVTVNGHTVDMSSEDGMMYPIVYDGHSYVSAKAVAEALGASVKWNNGTQTVEITSNNISAGVPNKDNTKPTTETSDVLHSKWQGTYTANQSDTSVTITIDGQVATFEFGPTSNNPNVPLGKYTTLVDYNKATNAITLTGVKWIIQPSNYEFVNFVGSISGDYINGSVNSVNKQAVGTFSIKLVK
ncbi:stalk domain-containing protein [Paenibacillus alginolyticus]|uniref:stalk domain-containing protein n=1 Tax=Paenibacillus alginolyticus TaxID=59839 RepID=UPI0028A928DA|nr:stalk domain-containing protein [Paenibacillus frigoriresistens]